MVTLKEIAQQCGVSVSTVSNILNGKNNKVSETTREKVMAVVRETGYQPNYFAQGMRKQKTHIIGIIVEDLDEFSTTPMVESMMAYCEDHGFRTILINMRMYNKWQDTWYDDDEKLQKVLQPAITEMLSIKVDAIAYVAGHCRVINCFPDNFPVPAICVYAISKSKFYTSVVVDDEKGGYDMTSHLISMGHERIGVICGERNNLHTQKRLLGYQKALYDARIPYNPEWIMDGNWERDTACACTEKLMAAGVTGIFCMNDRMAGGVYDFLYEKGIMIGRDVSVVGYDNMMLSEFLHPKLTTNELPLNEIGKVSMELLLEHVNGEGDAIRASKVVKVPCRMYIRESVSHYQKER